MIKVIALDLGGVLFSDATPIAAQSLEREHGYDPAIIRGLLHSPESGQLRRGRLTDEEFWSWAQTILPKGYDTDLIREVYYDSFILDPGVMSLMQRLHGKYTLMAFSGNIQSRDANLDRKYDFRKWFDREVYSYDHGMSKPEPGFFEAMLREAGVPGDQIFYVDDKDYYAPLCAQHGVHLHVYRRGEIRALDDAMRNAGIRM